LSTLFGELTPPSVYEGDTTIAPYSNQAQLTIHGYDGIYPVTYKGSGYMIGPQIGITAAHVVFDEDNLRFHSNIDASISYYNLSRYINVSKSASAVGWSEYATREAASPGETSVDKFNVDCAVFYTESPIASTVGNLVISDEIPNPALSSSRDKMLLGYPVDSDIIPVENQNSLHFSQAGITALTRYTGGSATDSSGMAWQLYESKSFLGVGGNSGGPLMVQNAEGTWEATAVLVGGNTQHTLVRALDTELTSLINVALINTGLPNYDTPIHPVVISNPQSFQYIPGMDYSLMAIASQDASTTFQWFKDGNMIPGANASSLPLPDISEDDIGSYYIQITNDLGTVESEVAHVSPLPPPSITRQPQSDYYLTTLGGGIYTGVSAKGYGTLSYQWFKDGSPLEDQTTERLYIAPVTVTDAGVYFCRVTGVTGITDTQPSTLHVSGFTNYLAPETIEKELGDTLTLDPGVYAEAPYSMQWNVNDQAIEGATGPILELNLDSLDMAGEYTLNLHLEQEGYGETIQARYELVLPKPVYFRREPNDSTYGPLLYSNTDLNYYFNTVGDNSPFTYQWFFNDEPIDASELILEPVIPESAGTYKVIVTDSKGYQDTATVTLTPSTSLPPYSNYFIVPVPIPGKPYTYTAYYYSEKGYLWYWYDQEWQYLTGTDRAPWINEGNNSHYLDQISTNGQNLAAVCKDEEVLFVKDDTLISHEKVPDVKSAVATAYGTVALLEDGSLHFGNTYPDTTHRPDKLPEWKNITKLIASDNRIIAMTVQHKLLAYDCESDSSETLFSNPELRDFSCYGQNLLVLCGHRTIHQLGYQYMDGETPTNSPVPNLPENTTVKAIATMRNVSLTLLSDGSLLTWGKIPVPNEFSAHYPEPLANISSHFTDCNSNALLLAGESSFAVLQHGSEPTGYSLYASNSLPREGEKVTLSVAPYLEEQTSLIWLHNDEVIPHQTGSTMVFESFSKGDVGEYSIQYDGPNGTGTSSINLTMDGPPFFSVVPSQIQVMENKTLIISPSINTSVDLEVSWTHNGVPIGTGYSYISVARSDSGGQYIASFDYNGVEYSSSPIEVIVVPVIDYESWLDQHEQLTQRGTTEDPDNDHFSNLMEFYFGTDPTIADSPTTWKNDDRVYFAINRQAWTGNNGPLPFKTEVSYDLVNWSQIFPSPRVHDYGPWAEIHIDIENSPTPRCFIRFSTLEEE